MSLNMNSEFFGSKPPPAKLGPWLDEQESWMAEQIKTHASDPYWQTVNLVVQQYEGLIAGYQATADPSHPLKRFDFQVLNGVGDLLDLMSVITPQNELKDPLTMPTEEFERMQFKRGMCSAIVKVTGDYSEMFASHSSWFTYSAMSRIYKHYYFNLNESFIAARKVSFSSYPGFLESLDDFYLMDSGLAMIQTTNSVFNQSLYSLVVPQSLLAWHRVKVANFLAHDGPEWYNAVKQYNSGTYNNQYDVIDYNKFTPGQPLVPNTLFVVEQIPGLVVGGDVTHELERGYFPSYNVPYWELIYNLSGYPAVVKQHGPDYSYQLAPRAKIFRRDQTSVVDLASLKHIMRYNEYETDPYSKGNPGAAICSRGDLRNPPSLGGCYDTKVTSASLFATMTSEAINGPTYQDQPVFVWKDAWSKVAHFGQPTTFNFGFQTMQPNMP
jgi:hypothetical protein